MIKIIIFINEEIITKEPKGLIMKITINVIIIKEYRQTFLVTSTEESIFILYILLEKVITNTLLEKVITNILF